MSDIIFALQLGYPAILIIGTLYVCGRWGINTFAYLSLTLAIVSASIGYNTNDFIVAVLCADVLLSIMGAIGIVIVLRKVIDFGEEE